MILTLTMNPAIDISAEVDEVAPIRKLRCANVVREAGGGGINVARVLRRFGAEVVAVYPVGGPVGQLLRDLVDHESIPSITIPIAQETRDVITSYSIHYTKLYDLCGRAALCRPDRA